MWCKRIDLKKKSKNNQGYTRICLCSLNKTVDDLIKQIRIQLQIYL